jgi:DNA-binding NarL/FixJ family response regulator
VVVVDDQRLVRDGLSALLAGQPEIVVAGEAATASTALAECHRVCPDVLLVDALLPEMAAFTLIRQVRGRYPKIRVIALVECDRLQCMLRPPGAAARMRCWLLGNGHNGGNGRQECEERALLAGAHAVLRKTQSSHELLQAIQSAFHGDRGTDSKSSCRAMGDETESSPAPDAGMHEGLTAREVEVVRGILHGHSNKEIARTLVVREQTIKNVVSRVLRKLRLHDRVQVALYAVETRLLDRYNPLLPCPVGRPDGRRTVKIP